MADKVHKSFPLCRNKEVSWDGVEVVSLGLSCYCPSQRRLAPPFIIALSRKTRALNDPSVFTITEKTPTEAFSWLKALMIIALVSPSPHVKTTYCVLDSIV